MGAHPGRLTVIIVRRPGATAEAAEIIAFARERLAHFKCPTSVDYVESLPRNPSGPGPVNRIDDSAVFAPVGIPKFAWQFTWRIGCPHPPRSGVRRRQCQDTTDRPSPFISTAWSWLRSSFWAASIRPARRPNWPVNGRRCLHSCRSILSTPASCELARCSSWPGRRTTRRSPPIEPRCSTRARAPPAFRACPGICSVTPCPSCPTGGRSSSAGRYSTIRSAG